MCYFNENGRRGGAEMGKKLKNYIKCIALLILVMFFFLGVVSRTSTVSAATIQDLKNKFPNGAYWNHVVQNGHRYNNYQDVGSCNNPDGYTWTPCNTHNGNVGIGGHDCNTFQNAMQCYGFAKKLAYDLYGSTHSSWGTTTIIQAKRGDVIHYKGGGADATNGHWAMIINKSGTTVTLGECNFTNAPCKISWGRTLNVSGLNYTIYSAPWEASYDIADTMAPNITNQKITDVTKDGYTVTCTVSDNKGVTSVKFPSWNSDIHIGEDAKWLQGSVSGNTASVHVKLSDLKSGAREGNYTTHIYAYDAAGNSSCVGVSVFVDRTAPVISDVSITSLSRDGYTVRCKVKDNVGIDRVQFPTWTLKDGQDDLLPDWVNSIEARGNYNSKDGYYYFNVQTAQHNGETGIYKTHIYAYDKCGNYICFNGEDVTAKVEISSLHVQTKAVCEYHSKDVNSYLYFIVAGSKKIELSSVEIITTATVAGSKITVKKEYGARTIEAAEAGFFPVASFLHIIDNKDLQGAQGPIQVEVHVIDEHQNEGVSLFQYDTSSYNDTIYTTMYAGETVEVQFSSLFDGVHYMEEACTDVIAPVKNQEGKDSRFFTAKKPGRAYIAGYKLGSGESIFQVVDVIAPNFPMLKTESEYEINTDDLLIGVLPGENTVQKVCSNFSNDNLICRDSTGKTLSDTDILGTGFTVSTMEGTTEKTVCTIAMTGDIYGDGKIDGKDISVLLQYRLGKKNLTKEQIAAGDVHKDGKIDGKDISKLLQYRLGKIKSLE